MNSPARRIPPMAMLLLRVLVSVGLLVGVAWGIGFEVSLEQLRQMNLTLLVAAYLIVLVDGFIRTVNWHQILGGLGLRVTVWGLYYCFLIGAFFGTFIPSSVGTDVTRSVIACRTLGGRIETYAAAMVSMNIIQLVAVSLWGATAAAWLLAAGNSEPHIPLILIGCIVVVVAFFCAFAWVVRHRSRVTPGVVEPGDTLLERLLARFRRFAVSLLAFGEGSTSLTMVLGTGLLIQASRLMVFYLVSLAVGLHVPWFAFCLFGPVFVVAALVPASVAGFGAAQAVFVGFFAIFFGVATQDAFLISIVHSSLYVLYCLMGGVVYLGSASRQLFAGAAK